MWYVISNVDMYHFYRSVDEKDKALALGLAFSFVSAFANIPAPALFNFIFGEYNNFINESIYFKLKKSNISVYHHCHMVTRK